MESISKNHNNHVGGGGHKSYVFCRDISRGFVDRDDLIRTENADAHEHDGKGGLGHDAGKQQNEGDRHPDSTEDNDTIVIGFFSNKA